MTWNEEDCVPLPHKYVLEVDGNLLFNTVRSDLPSILQFLQDEGHIKGYSLDNAASIGDKVKGFIRGRLCYRTDIYIDASPLIENLAEEIEDEGEDTDDNRK